MFLDVTIIGCGNVGSTIALLLMNQKRHRLRLNIMEPSTQREGKFIELKHVSALFPNIELHFNNGTFFQQAHMVIHTAGVGRKITQSRMEVAEDNCKLSEQIFNGVNFLHHPLVLVVANPVDLLTRAMMKILGEGSCTVVGSGTLLDSMRFRAEIAENFGCPASSIDAQVLGEHGNSMVPVFSSIQMNGQPVKIDDPLKIKTIDHNTRFAASMIKKTQDATYFGIANATLEIFHAWFSDSGKMLLPLSVPVSKWLQDKMKNDFNEVCISQPLWIGNRSFEYGEAKLDEWEWEQLKYSCEFLEESWREIVDGA